MVRRRQRSAASKGTHHWDATVGAVAAGPPAETDVEKAARHVQLFASEYDLRAIVKAIGRAIAAGDRTALDAIVTRLAQIESS